MDDEPQFATLDELTELRQSYYLPPEQWDRMVAFAQHIAERDAISPLKRRMRTFLTGSQPSLFDRALTALARFKLTAGFDPKQR